MFIKHFNESNEDFENRINKELEELCENCDGIQYSFNDETDTFCFSFSYLNNEETKNLKKKLDLQIGKINLIINLNFNAYVT